MPAYRGILVSVMSQWDSNQFPEFRHPDSPDFKPEVNLSEISFESQRTLSASVSTSRIPASKADRILGRIPSISCYIPSLPGVQFFLKYAVQPPHPDGQYFYFKLFMNGRHITSWGVAPRTNPQGHITRALFEAEEKWDVKMKRNNVFKQSGIEKRPFLFTEENCGKSAAEDGGLIEVQVFRSRGRRRRAPIVERFRPQEHYGIQLPGVGLVENPQDMKYFEWVLIDPKDTPYATFYFHYRSWDYLQSLQIIPLSHPRKLLPPSNSFAHLHRAPDDRGGSEGEDDVSYFLDDPESWSPEFRAQHRPVVYDDGSNGEMHPGSRIEKDYDFDSPDDEDVLKQFRAPFSTVSVPNATISSKGYERPLPEPPVRKYSFDLGNPSPNDKSRSRGSSASSGAISVTPSLLPWLDRDSNNSSPDHIISVATTMRFCHLESPTNSSLPHEYPLFSGAERYKDPLSYPSPSSRSISDRVTSPDTLVLPPNVTVRKSRRNLTPEIFGYTRVRIEESDNEIDQEIDITHPFRGTNFAPPETEWLRREQVFPPVNRDPEGDSWPLPSSNGKGKKSNVGTNQSQIREMEIMAAATSRGEDDPFFYSHALSTRPGTPHISKGVGPRTGNWI